LVCYCGFYVVNIVIGTTVLRKHTDSRLKKEII
jgi:hypothetical protein